jgi:hypothetical protein
MSKSDKSFHHTVHCALTLFSGFLFVVIFLAAAGGWATFGTTTFIIFDCCCCDNCTDAEAIGVEVELL